MRQLVPDCLDQINAKIVREFYQVNRDIGDFMGYPGFFLGCHDETLLRGFPLKMFQQLVCFDGNVAGEVLWVVELHPVSGVAKFADETADFFEFGHAGHRRPQRSFRKCFIDAVDSEFPVAAHWQKG